MMSQTQERQASVTVSTVFLDLYHTLAYFHPAREHRLCLALQEFGFQADLNTLRRAYLAADHYYTLAGLEKPLHLLSPKERQQLYTRYQQVVMEETRLAQALPVTEQIYRKYSELERDLRLFPDVEPALAQLREAGYRLGLITNVTDDPTADLEGIGLRERFDVVVASCLVGFDKPDPRIFQAAMKDLGIAPEEGVHVGDQFLADVEGAQSAGLKAILLDRHDLQEGRHPLRVRSLLELPPLLRNGFPK